jgi:hypothetical protein
MPKETVEYYRAMTAYTKSMWSRDDFGFILANSQDNLRMSAPPDCDKHALTSNFFYYDEGDIVRYFYFENRDEMMRYKAALFNDKQIYKDYLAEEAEIKIINKHKWGNS